MRKLLKKREVLIVVIIGLMTGNQVTAKEVGKMLAPEFHGWSRSDTIQTVTEKTIFDYMDGAGELYIGYRFDHLEVMYYSKPGQDDILVELYYMKSPEDAFGLLSLDWNGEPVNLDDSVDLKTIPVTIPSAHAIYGFGLLRFWSGNVYGRIMAYQETAESRVTVLAMGKACTKERSPSRYPEWIDSLPLSIAGEWNLDKNQIHYLRTHLALNSIYFLSYSNILQLDLSTEIVAGQYRQASDENNQPVYLFTIRYASKEKADAALASFHQAYYPEIPVESSSSKSFTHCTENHWSGHFRKGALIILGFEFSEETLLKKAFTEVVLHIEKQIGGQP